MLVPIFKILFLPRQVPIALEYGCDTMVHFTWSANEIHFPFYFNEQSLSLPRDSQLKDACGRLYGDVF